MSTAPQGVFTSIISWMARNAVAANMLMISLLVGGTFALQIIEQEALASFTLDSVEVSVEYPGASPAEVEESILLAIETEIRDITAIRKVSATASEGNGRIQIELTEGSDANIVLQDIKIAIDRIQTFPNDAERPEVSLAEDIEDIVAIALSGDVDEQTLYAHAKAIRDELLVFPDIAKVEIKGARRPEIIIEIPEQELRPRDLTLQSVADIVTSAATDVPAGSVRGANGETLIRTMGRRNNAADFADIEIMQNASEGQLHLANIASIKEGFEDTDQLLTFNGKSGFELVIYQTSQARVLGLSERIYDYIDTKQSQLPSTVTLQVLDSKADDFRERISLLFDNGFVGLILVVIALALFMEARLAFWVSASIPVVLIGAMTFMPMVSVPLNMVTLFAFIITLGIVVDDAVIVGENIYRHIQNGKPVEEAVVDGVTEMIVPVMFAVGTNILAFLPSMFLPGEIGMMLKPMAMLVFAIFIVSLIEALFILPAHLMGMRGSMRQYRFLKGKGWLSKSIRAFAQFRQKLALSFDRLRDTAYSQLLHKCMQNPLNVSLVFFGLTFVIFTWVGTGRIDVNFAPKIESSRIDVEFEMPAGTPFSLLEKNLEHIDQAAVSTLKAFGGEHFAKNTLKEATGNTGSVTIMLVSQEDRPFAAADFVHAWRENVGTLAGPTSVFYDFEIGPGGNKELEIELSHSDPSALEAAAYDLADQISRLEGVEDIDTGFKRGKPQLSLYPTPLALSLGLNAGTIGKQLRDNHYGNEAIRQIRGGDEIRVRIRRPENERNSVTAFKNMIILAPNGTELALTEAATIEYGHAYAEINRTNSKRIVTVTGNINRQIANVSLIRKEVSDTIMPAIVARHNGLKWSAGGEEEMEEETNTRMIGGTLICFAAIFAVLSALFRSYMDSIIVMLVIPFCIAFAIFGHIVMGFPINVLSTFGFISLSGLVINGSLVLTMRAKERMAEGMPLYDAVHTASMERFRPILLTSLTTTIGLVPMLFEVSTQALFLIPLAIALSFGSFFSIWTILLLTPSILLAWHQFRNNVVERWKLRMNPSLENQS